MCTEATRAAKLRENTLVVGRRAERVSESMLLSMK